MTPTSLKTFGHAINSETQHAIIGRYATHADSGIKHFLQFMGCGGIASARNRQVEEYGLNTTMEESSLTAPTVAVRVRR